MKSDPTTTNDAPTVKTDTPTVKTDAPTVKTDAPTVSRRRALAMAGTTAGAFLAGCVGGGGGGNRGGGAGDGGEGSPTTRAGPTPTTGTGDPAPTTDTPEPTPTTAVEVPAGCESYVGDLVAYDPGEFDWAFGFGVPETYEEFDRENTDMDSSLFAQFGHAPTATGDGYLARVQVRQDSTTTSLGRIEQFASITGETEPLVIGGESIPRGTRDLGDGRRIWRTGVPAGGDRYYFVSVVAVVEAGAEDCRAAVEAAALGVMNSFERR